MPPKPRISVVIPAFNEASRIAKAIDSVSAADQVIVVDGESSDETASVAERSGAMVIESQKGRGVQLNRGAESANGDLLIFLHADCWLATGSIQQILERYNAAGSGKRKPLYGCFRQRIDDPSFRFRLVERGNAARASWFRLPYGDQAIFVDRATYDSVSGIPPVALMEDVILARRLSKITRPVLLEGPVHVSARRWVKQGVLRQTVKNWTILTAFAAGVSPDRLAAWYQGSSTPSPAQEHV